MGSSGMKPLEENAKAPPPPPPSSFSENWKERILIPTLLAGFYLSLYFFFLKHKRKLIWNICEGITGGGVGLVSKHRKVHGLANISTTYATNFSIVTGCYCGKHLCFSNLITLLSFNVVVWEWFMALNLQDLEPAL
jgi:hypothetical protein